MPSALLLAVAALVAVVRAETFFAPLSRRFMDLNETLVFQRRRLGDTIFQLEPLYGSVRDNGCVSVLRSFIESSLPASERKRWSCWMCAYT